MSNNVVPHKVLSQVALFFMALGVLLIPQPGMAAPVAQEEAEWLIMLYQVADDNTLEQDILIDLNEAEIVGSTDEVHVVAQVDRYEGGFDGMEDWTTTKRFYLTADDDLNEIYSEEIDDLGETNMSDSSTLVEFITWAVAEYPAQKYALIMSDHGVGWVGGFGDPDPGIAGAHDLFLVDWFEHDMLWLMEIDEALEIARDETGIEQFDVITLDVCLMGQLEVFNALAPHTLYAVASEEVVPGVGMAYADFLGQLVDNPSMDGGDLATVIAQGFLDNDLRIQQEEFSGGLSPEVVAGELFHDSTITAVDSSEIANVNEALDEFINSLAEVDPDVIAEARAYAQAFETPFGEEFPSSFIDLGHFAQLTAELSEDDAVAEAAEALQAAIEQAILLERHGPGKPGATGMAIHLPVPDLYAIADNLQYSTIAARFAEETQWDEFLAVVAGAGQPTFARPRPEAEDEYIELTAEIDEAELEDALDYVIQLLEDGFPPDEIIGILQEEEYSEEVIQVVVAEVFSQNRSRSAAVAGSKPLQLGALTLSSNVATITEPVTIDTEISGSRLAYVYQFIGRYAPRDNLLIYEDIDFIAADSDKTIGGVTYPDWGESPLELSFDWEPIIYAISDGEASVKALFDPEMYGTAPSYSVQGTYHFANGSPDRFAKMYFRDANGDEIIEMNQVFGYSGNVITDSVGAPREIYPQVGDSFTVIVQGEDTETGDIHRQFGETITFTETFIQNPFFIEEIPAPSGNYVIGVIAEDLDGATQEEYEQIFVYNSEAATVEGFAPYINDEFGFALLYPQDWTIEEDETGVTLTGESGFAFVTRSEYPEAVDPTEADQLAMEEVTTVLTELDEFENLEFTTEMTDTYLGAFEAQSREFAYEIEGEPFYGEVIASTPVATATYLLLISALDSEYDAVLETAFEPLIFSFDTNITGLSGEQIGPPPPDFAEETFSDDYSDSASGLLVDEIMPEGQLTYQDEQYVFALPANPDFPLYDYYLEETLPEPLMIQVTASFTGSADNAYGLVFQLLPGEEYDEFYTFRISGDGYYTAEKVGEELTDLISWTPSSLINQEEGAENIITVTGYEGDYQLYINGYQVDSFSDPDYQDGTFGLAAENYDTQQPTSLFFDDLIVGTPAE